MARFLGRLRLTPALDAGVGCEVAVDQRYVPRDAYCDVGAFEFTDFTVVTITIGANVNVDRTTGRPSSPAR